MPAKNPRKHVQFRDIALETRLGIRASHHLNDSLSQVMRRDGDRYYFMLEMALRTLKGKFTVPEICVLFDISNGTRYNNSTITMLWASLLDSQEDGIGEKWGVDIAALAWRVRELNLLESFALVDALERFWARDDAIVVEKWEDHARFVGLI